MDSSELSPACRELLLYFCSVSTSVERRWESIEEAAECLEMPIEQVLPRINELVTRGLLELRGTDRQLVVVTADGRRRAKRISNTK